MSEKSTELIIYIAEQLKDYPNGGATHLNKSLYFTDLMYYLNHGTTVSDFQYVNQDNGPTPDPGRFLILLRLLEEGGDIEVVQIPHFNYKQKRILPKRPANIAVFEKEEIVLINDVVKKIGPLSAKEASDLTHELVAWKVSSRMEELPNFTFLITSKEPQIEDYKWAQQAWEKFNRYNSNR